MFNGGFISWIPRLKSNLIEEERKRFDNLGWILKLGQWC